MKYGSLFSDFTRAIVVSIIAVLQLSAESGLKCDQTELPAYVGDRPLQFKAAIKSPCQQSKLQATNYQHTSQPRTFFPKSFLSLSLSLSIYQSKNSL